MSEIKSAPVQRTVTGTVVSNKNDKTITLEVERKVKHAFYGKIITKTSKVTAHDEENSCQEGDVVTVAQSKPLSKSKTWTLLKINQRANSTNV